MEYLSCAAVCSFLFFFSCDEPLCGYTPKVIRLFELVGKSIYSIFLMFTAH